jgi:leucyl aminopeptidase
MLLDIKFLKQDFKKNILIFCDLNLKISGLDECFSKQKISEIKKNILNEQNLIKKENIIVFNINPNQKIIVQRISENSESTSNEKNGAILLNVLKKNYINEVNFLENNVNFFLKKNKNFICDFLLGLNLKSYEFIKYKTKVNLKKISIFFPKKFKTIIDKKHSKYFSLFEGIKLTKNLVSEPGNVLHPDEYVNRIKSLRSFGLKVTIFDKTILKKIGMNALLGVGQGSVRGSYLVIIEWNGSNKKTKPVAFVGKGVCFDTGGISLKPAKFMEDMTYDMAGSAVVVGLMKNLALRKSKVNAVGVVGLVENMPDGNAQRPGDIVKSYCGKTIEILNTDAEGRLVLADALSYTEKKYKPKFIVDLATLTGAIIVSLGSEYAGLFSNNDELSDQLLKAGEITEEKVWRMPLNNNYDKLINSKKADMQNINYNGGAGSITAAQFLQRFILNKTPWAHLDIAGMAFSKYGGALNSGGATGYGVRLLNQLIEDNYE